MGSLNGRTWEPLPVSGRRVLINECWELRLTRNEFDRQALQFEAYFQHYEEECAQVPQEDFGNLRHKDIVHFFQTMKKSKKEDCLEQVRRRLVSNSAPNQWPNGLDEVVERWLVFTSRALFLIDCEGWEPNETMQEFLLRYFEKCTLKDAVQLPKVFHARNLEKIGGFDIRWTAIIGDHLQVQSQSHGLKVAIFHHVQILQLYQNLKQPLLPRGFLAETEKSIALLLPKYDDVGQKWFKKKRKSYTLDPTAAACGHLISNERRVESFEYWCDRLIILKEAYDEHEPKGLLQFWRDDRKPIQWWTFWIALVVFVLAIIQSIEGALQVYKAYHPA